MEPAIESEIGVCDEQEDDLSKIIRRLSGRVIAEIYVINGRTGEKVQMFTWDFDNRDSVEVVFNKDDGPEGGAVVGDNSYTFSFLKQPGEEVEDLKTQRKQDSPEAIEAKLGEALRQTEPEVPTIDDYMNDAEVSLVDLSIEDQLAVLAHDIDLIYDAMELYGFQTKKKSSGLLKRLFSKTKD